jgi:Xaa-Pro aminopeptidase
MESPKITAIRQAQRITDRVYSDIRPLLKVGVTELSVAQEIERRGLALGASRLAFPVMIGSGPKGAVPHAVPGLRRFKSGDLVVIDFGFVVDGYHSDMSRTVAIGRPSATARTVYDLVLKAQRAALRQVRAGITGADLDAVARDIIRDGGYGEQFIHTLGHGVGRKIHQFPRLAPTRGSNRLKTGDVVTIEPGIYLPREFGVRIEDLVIVTETGCENLTKSPKQLKV